MDAHSKLCASIAALSLLACGGGSTQDGPRSGTDLLAFSLVLQTGPATIDGAGHSVTAEVSTSGRLAHLVPTLAVSPGATVSPASGSTVDFGGGPVTFTVTAEDGTRQAWTVTVRKLQPQRRIFFAAGPDGVLGNADDVVSAYIRYEYDLAGHLVRMAFRGLGADQTWFTADDPVTQMILVETDAAGETTRQTTVASRADGAYGSADDVIIVSVDFVYVPDGSLLRQVSRTKGTDGVWFTADDGVASYYEVLSDADGRMVGLRQFNSKGGDGAWFTADDGVSGLVAMEIDAAGNLLAGRTYNAPGADGRWGTADDVMIAHYLQENR